MLIDKEHAMDLKGRYRFIFMYYERKVKRPLQDISFLKRVPTSYLCQFRFILYQTERIVYSNNKQ